MVDFDNSAVGAVIKRLRKEKRLSQEVLSGLAGIARSHLAMIETGKKQANLETVWKIANAFAVPVHALVRLIEEQAAKNQQK